MPAKGRPRFNITKEVCDKAESLAAQGLTQDQIAHCLGIHLSTLCDKKKSYSEFSDAIKRGKAKGIAAVSNKLFERAREGDNTSMIFFLKNRDPENWSDRREINHSGSGEPVKVIERVIIKDDKTTN